jgi:hypothetical protein
LSPPAPAASKACFPFQAIRQCALYQILGSAPKGHEQVMVVRIDGGTSPRQIGLYRNLAFLDAKLPAFACCDLTE